MTGRRALVPAALAAALGGCVQLEEPGVTAIALELCPATATPRCTAVADGVTPLVVRAQVTAPQPHASLQMKLRASAGSFAGADAAHPAEIDLAFQRNSEAFATYLPPPAPGVVRFAADAAGVVVEYPFPIAATAVTDVLLTPTPPRLAGDATPTALQITAVTASAHVSAGTVLRLSLTAPDPPGSYFQVFPDRGVVDAGGAMQATLQKDAAGRGVTLVVVAESPVAIGVETPPAFAELFPLTSAAPP